LLLWWRPLILLSLLLSAPAALAQDAHYWHHQYGNRADMLGGAVIGSSDDVSAVDDNPALLTVAERLNLTVSGNAFFTSTIRLHDALGAEADLVNTKVGAVPSLVAGEIPIGGEEQRHLPEPPLPPAEPGRGQLDGGAEDPDLRGRRFPAFVDEIRLIQTMASVEDVGSRYGAPAPSSGLTTTLLHSCWHLGARPDTP
jgi:hypothetical protein